MTQVKQLLREYVASVLNEAEQDEFDKLVQDAKANGTAEALRDDGEYKDYWRLRIVKNGDKFTAYVDSKLPRYDVQLYGKEYAENEIGSAKRPATLSKLFRQYFDGVKQRRERAAQEPRVSGSEWEANLAYKELKRREKNKW